MSRYTLRHPSKTLVLGVHFAGERPAQEEFLENLQSAAQALQDIILPVLKFVAGKTTAEL